MKWPLFLFKLVMKLLLQKRLIIESIYQGKLLECLSSLKDIEI